MFSIKTFIYLSLFVHPFASKRFFSAFRVDKDFDVPISFEAPGQNVASRRRTEESLLESAVLMPANMREQIQGLSQDYRLNRLPPQPVPSAPRFNRPRTPDPRFQEVKKNSNLIQGFKVKGDLNNKIIFLSVKTLEDTYGIDNFNEISTLAIDGQFLELIPGLQSELPDGKFSLPTPPVRPALSSVRVNRLQSQPSINNQQASFSNFRGQSEPAPIHTVPNAPFRQIQQLQQPARDLRQRVPEVYESDDPLKQLQDLKRRVGAF